jgi:hypothetical protein
MAVTKQCHHTGNKGHDVRDGLPAPFADRPDAELIARGIGDLMAMPSAGDFVIYGIDAPQGTVSFVPEWGAHAGPSHDELQTFIMHPARVAAPASLTHPVELYDHFIRYQEDMAAPEPMAARREDPVRSLG